MVHKSKSIEKQVILVEQWCDLLTGVAKYHRLHKLLSIFVSIHDAGWVQWVRFKTHTWQLRMWLKFVYKLLVVIMGLCGIMPNQNKCVKL